MLNAQNGRTRAGDALSASEVGANALPDAQMQQGAQASPDPRCGAEKTTDGEPCESQVGLCPKCGQCIMHCEHRKRERKKAHKKGGMARASQKRGRRDQWIPEADALPRAETLEDCALWLSTLAHAVTVGDISADRADKARANIRDLKDLLLRDQEERIDELRRVIDQLKRDRKAGR